MKGLEGSGSCVSLDLEKLSLELDFEVSRARAEAPLLCLQISLQLLATDPAPFLLATMFSTTIKMD